MEQTPSEPSERRGAGDRSRRIGRRVAQGIYYLLVSGLIAAFTVQITRQVFFPAEPTETAPYTSCRAGLDALYLAVERGRVAARQARGAEADDEQALVRYREEVNRTWQYHGGVVRLCQTPNDSSLLDALERLRYSEEHGVRHEATELTALRQRVRLMFNEQPPATH